MDFFHPNYMLMESQKVDIYLIANSKFFEPYQLMEIREILLNSPENKFPNMHMQQFHDPTVILIVSILVGTLGIDRFLIGDIGLGFLKLITLGGLGIWTIIDWFIIMRSTKIKNFKKLMNSLNLQ